jgi:hypothetical protein
MAAKLFGQPAVIRWVRETAWQFECLVRNTARRILAACRALVSVDIDEDSAKDALAESVEEQVLHRVMQQVNVINNHVYDLRTRLDQIEQPAVAANNKHK